MAVRPAEPQKGNNAAAAALLVLAGWIAGPVLAAPDHDLLRDECHDDALEVSQQELTATPVNTSDELLTNHLLKPRVEATVRKVFDEVEEEVANDAADPTEAAAAPELVIQGLSDGEVTPLRRQMYRRDI
jgi:hypothetical protein